MKRAIGVVTVVVLAAVTACSSSSKSSSSSPTSSGTTSAPSTSAIASSSVAASAGTSTSASSPASGAPAATCTGKTQNINLLRATNNPPDNDVIAAWDAANPCNPIKISEVPFGELFDKISVLAASSNPPDVYSYDGPDTQTYAATGVLLPLDKYVSAAWKADIVPATLAEHSYQGKLYSPGLEQSAQGLFYNKTMLDKLGIKPPDSVANGWTWPQAEAAMQKCQVGPKGNATVWGLAPSQFGNGTPGFTYRDLDFARSAGDPTAPKGSSLYNTYYAISADGKTADGYLNTPEAITADTFYQQMYTTVGITPKAGIPNAFIDQKACFDIETSNFIGSLQKANVKFDWGVTPLPYFKTPITQTGSGTLGVSAKTKIPDIAAKFVVFVTSSAEQLVHVKEDTALPALKSLYASQSQFNSYPLSIFRDELVKYGQPRPPSPNFLQYDTIVTTALRNIAYGSDVKSQLNQAVSQLKTALSQN